jgi:hypothetical protein
VLGERATRVDVYVCWLRSQCARGARGLSVEHAFARGSRACVCLFALERRCCWPVAERAALSLGSNTEEVWRRLTLDDFEHRWPAVQMDVSSVHCACEVKLHE